MNQKFLDLIESSSPFEVDLSEMNEMLTVENFMILAKYRPNLESLTLDMPDVEALKCLTLFPKIKNLFIKDSLLACEEEEWVESICSLSQLTHLAIQHCHDIDSTFIEKLCILHNIISLDFTHAERICDENIHFFSKFKHLRFLNINGAGYLEDSEMTFLTNLSNLEGLELAYTNFSNDGYQKLSVLHNLKYLNLSGTKISDESLKVLSSSLPNLELLNLNNCENITSKGLTYLEKFTKLRLIYVSNYPKLTWSANMESLDSAYLRFTDKEYLPISFLINLKYLDLSGTKVTDENLKMFSSALYNLEIINLNNCQNISEQGLHYLNKLPKLGLIYMNNCPQVSKNLIQQISSLKLNTNFEAWEFWNSLTKNYQ